MEFLEEEVEDFDEFLDQEMEESAAEGIMDIETANYYIGRVKKNNAMKAMFEDNAKSLVTSYKDRVTLWKDTKLKALDSDNERILAMLKEYFDKTAKDKSSKLRFVEGSIGFYKTRQKVDIDEKAVMHYLESTYEDMEPYTKTKVELDKTAFKKAGEIDPATGVFKLDNQVVPGVNVTLAGEEFNVR